MWQITAQLAQDIVRERYQEAERHSAWRRAEEHAAAERQAHPGLLPARPVAAPRRALAAALRRVAAGAGFLARSARATAAQLDGQSVAALTATGPAA